MRPGTLPPAVVTLEVAGRTPLHRSEALVMPCVRLARVPHPALEALLEAAGAAGAAQSVRHPARFAVPSSRRAAAAARPELVAALAAPHPGLWQPPKGQSLADVWGPDLSAAVASRLGVRVEDLGSGSVPARFGRARLGVRRDGAWLRISLRHHDVVSSASGLASVSWMDPGGRWQRPVEAWEDLERARLEQMVVLHEGARAEVVALEQLVARSCSVIPAPGAPAYALVKTGRDVTCPVQGLVPAAKAIAAVSRMPAGVATAIDAAVVQAAAAQSPAPAPAGDPDGPLVLRAWQAQFLGAYLSSGPGLVNALPPGSGKTACAAGAIRERARTRPRYRCVVLAPATLREQWRTELAKFVPNVGVHVVDSTNAWTPARKAWRDADGPVVVVMTAALLAQATPAQSSGPLRVLSDDLVDLVADEATYLSNPETQQARAAWRLRGAAESSMVLTGTPDQRGLRGVGELVAFARNNPAMFTDHPLDEQLPHARSLQGLDRVAGLVFAGPQQAAATLPKANPAPVTLTPGPIEQAVDQAARARVADLVNSKRPAVTRLRTELAAWRLGLASPAALLASDYPLAADVRAAVCVSSVGESVKVSWSLERVAQLVAAGEQVLVFSDFLHVLDDVSCRLQARGVAAAAVTSKVSAKARGKLVDDFAAGRLRVLLIAATGQVGLNLQAAATVVHLDVPADAATLHQRTARAARMGSDKTRVSVEVPVLAGLGDHALLDVICDPSHTKTTGDVPAAGTLELARQLIGQGAGGV